MDFRIADTFTDSLARLTGDEQKAVKTTAFDPQMNPVNTGMQLHKLERQKLLVGACERRYSDHRSQVTTGHSYREYDSRLTTLVLILTPNVAGSESTDQPASREW